MSNNKTIGFIILRHVNSVKTNEYWKHCYKCIRRFYPENPILIVDSNSDKKYISDISLYKTTVVESEFPGRGLLLPYYYYLKLKPFDTAVIFHDSVFIHKYINFNVDTYKILWEFEHDWDNPSDEIAILNIYNDEKIVDFYKNKDLWKGCFGALSVVTHEYLSEVNSIYSIEKLLDVIKEKPKHLCFERIIAVLLQICSKEKKSSLLGDIHKYCRWGIRFSEKDKYLHLPILKTWGDRV